MEIFVAAISLVGIGVMLRVIKLQAAFMTIGLVCLGAALLPSAGQYAEHVPAWMFWGVVIILGISLLRTILAALFGSSVADSFTGNLLSAVLKPVVALFEGLVKSVFRMR